MTESRINVMVEGRVQGVYFRASTREQALALGLTGWVRNLPNGQVEFEAQGPEDKLAQLLAWAKQGPQQAQVSHMEKRTVALLPAEQSFEITR